MYRGLSHKGTTCYRHSNFFMVTKDAASLGGCVCRVRAQTGGLGDAGDKGRQGRGRVGGGGRREREGARARVCAQGEEEKREKKERPAPGPHAHAHTHTDECTHTHAHPHSMSPLFALSPSLSPHWLTHSPSPPSPPSLSLPLSLPPAPRDPFIPPFHPIPRFPLPKPCPRSTHTRHAPPEARQAISTTGVLNATTLIYARRAGITAAAGTRLALFLHSA